MKKVLITFNSQTGNTAKIAGAISEELSDCDVHIKPIKECASINLNNYDVLFIGSPIIAAEVSQPAQNFMEKLQISANCTVAIFMTHAAAIHKTEDYIHGIEFMQQTCMDKGIAYAGSFSCTGFLNPEIHDFIKERKGFSDVEWEEKVNMMKGHPNNTDLANAKKFARDVINSVQDASENTEIKAS
ncbi:MAG: hypothetical protein GY754_08620 [bacterium]|nr:hypothetical protein [bacterium]